VELDDNRDADDAVYELSGKELCGERVVVEHARGPRRDRDGDAGNSKCSLVTNDIASAISPCGGRGARVDRTQTCYVL